MSQKKSVDEIWKELNAKKAPRHVLPSELKGAKVAVPAVASGGSEIPSLGRGPALASAPLASSSPADVSDSQLAHKPISTWDPTSAGSSPEERDEYTQRIQRDINCLSEQDRNVRRTGAQRILSRLTQGDASLAAPSPALFQAVLCGALLSPLVRMLADPVEKCRELAAEIFLTALRVIPDVDALLPALLPALVRRVGLLPVAEGTEEIRLQIITMLEGPVLARASPRALEQFAPDLAKVLCRGLEDGYPEVKKLACSALVALSKRCGAKALEKEAESLVKASLVAASHQHSRVRQSAVSALGALLQAAGCSLQFFEEVVVPGMRPLALDGAPQIRQATWHVFAAWLGEPSAQYDADLWAPRLLPLMLLGLTDEVSELQGDTLQAVERVGEAWARRNRAASMEVDEPSSSAPAPAEPSALEVDAAQYPRPFQGPPGPGAAAMACALLPKVLPGVLKDLREWTVGLRSSAARVLQSLIVLAGRGLSPHLDSVIPALCGAMGDDEASVAALSLAAVHVIGALVPVDTWLPLAMDCACGSKPLPPQRASALVVLSGLLHSAARAKHPVAPEAVRTLAEALATDDVRACDHPGVRLQLAAAVTNLVRAAGESCRVAPLPLLQTLLELASREAEAATSNAARAALSLLAEACGSASSAEFIGLHTPHLLQRILPGYDAWTAGTGAFAALGALLRSTSEGSLRQLLLTVIPVLGNLMHHERDPAMRLELLRLLDALLEDPLRHRAFQGPFAEQLLYMVLLPACIWRVGKVAAAVRFSACVALGTLLRHGLLSETAVKEVLEGPDSLPILLQLMEEDYYSDTRVAACYIMELMLAAAGKRIDNEVKRKIYPELIKRLDDSSDACRIGTAHTLRAFCKEALPTYDDTNAGYLVAGMLIHMDDANQRVQEAVCEAVQAAAFVKPGPTTEEVDKVKSRHRTTVFCDRVLAVAAGAAAPSGPSDAGAAPESNSIANSALVNEST